MLKVIRRYRIEYAVWPLVHAFILQDKLGSPSRGSIDYFSLLIGMIMGTNNGTPRMSGPKLFSVQLEKSCIRHESSLESQLSRRTPLCLKIDINRGLGPGRRFGLHCGEAQCVRVRVQTPLIDAFTVHQSLTWATRYRRYTIFQTLKLLLHEFSFSMISYVGYPS